MFLPKIRTEDDEKKQKKLEIIGQLFRDRLPEVVRVIENEYEVKTNDAIATEIEWVFPKLFRDFETLARDDWEEWCDQYDAQADPVMDKFHYLRAEI